MVTPITFDKLGITVALTQLAGHHSSTASDLYNKLMSSWGHRPDRQRITVKLGEPELVLLDKLKLPSGTFSRNVLPSTGWYVIYRHPSKPRLEVKVYSQTKPPKRRVFTIGRAQRRLVAVKAVRVNSKKEAARMARKKKVVEEDELDELEGLEDLDDLEDEDLEDEEPEDEEEDDDEEEEAPPKRSRKTAAKKAPAKKTATRKKKVVVEEEDEDDDEDEDEEPAPKRRTKKAAAKPAAKKSSSSKGNNLPATRELPKGQVGPQDIAEMVGGECDARYVRIWLRDSEDYEREDGSRWAFSKTEAKGIVREIKASRKAAGV